MENFFNFKHYVNQATIEEEEKCRQNILMFCQQFIKCENFRKRKVVLKNTIRDLRCQLTQFIITQQRWRTSHPLLGNQWCGWDEIIERDSSRTQDVLLNLDDMNCCFVFIFITQCCIILEKGQYQPEMHWIFKICCYTLFINLKSSRKQ